MKAAKDTNKKPANNYPNIRSFAQRIAQEDLNFTSANLPPAENYYVGWMDLMGAGHAMNTSVQKAANFLARLHLSVEIARTKSGFAIHTLPINDGIFLIAKKKDEITTIMQHALALLAARFIATVRPKDCCLIKGGIAYGPVYFGEQLVAGVRLKKLRDSPEFLRRVMFGPAIIQAYRSEGAAPPYGIAVHESARAFCPPGESPFRMTHWLWWQTTAENKPIKGYPLLSELKQCLWVDLQKYFVWMEQTLLLQGVTKDKLDEWRAQASQYFTAD